MTTDRSWTTRPQEEEQARHDALHPGAVCRTCPSTVAYRAHLRRRVDLLAAPLPVRLLATLFGSDLRPTPRGLLAARVALVVLGLMAALLLALVLGWVADALVDPTPALPADGVET